MPFEFPFQFPVSRLQFRILPPGYCGAERVLLVVYIPPALACGHVCRTITLRFVAVLAIPDVFTLCNKRII
jgi:hypothetical protein